MIVSGAVDPEPVEAASGCRRRSDAISGRT